MIANSNTKVFVEFKDGVVFDKGLLFTVGTNDLLWVARSERLPN